MFESKQRMLLGVSLAFVLGAGSVAVTFAAEGGGLAGPKSATTKPEEKDEHEDKVPVDKLPAAVVEGVKKAMPEGKITDAEKQNEDGKITYELDVKVGDKTFEVVVGEAGNIISQKLDKED